MTTPEVAVCDACGWEGTQPGVTADTCPQCHQQYVNYFSPAGHHHGGLVMPTPTDCAAVCTCEGTPSDLPPLGTISGHHETCPVEVNAARRFNTNHSVLAETWPAGHTNS